MTSNQIVMSFHSDAVKDDTLLVAAAEGVEALAQPFRFDLDLVSADPGLDLSAILRVNARISLNRTMDLGDGRSGDIAYDYHGLLTDFRQIDRVGNNRYRYRAVLRPHLWKLASTRRSRIFTDKSVPDLLKAVLEEAGLSHRFIFADEKRYPINPYIVQYEETDFDFISRWIEHIGISYFYEADEDRGTIVFIDNARGYVSINSHDDHVIFDDQAAESVWSSGKNQRIRHLEIGQTRLPQRVQLKEYDYEAPTNALKYEIEVDANGLGTWYEYNSNYRTEREAKLLLEVRRDYWLGRRQNLRGVTDHRSFQAGRTFTLKEHYNPQVNDANYVLIEVRHHISQANGNDVGTTGAYTCDFVAISANLVFRPERTTAWPSIHGVVHARIAGGALDFAEIDAMGRYKIDVDYDTNEQTIGKVRMAQPSVGEDAGMNFPLRNNTEVLLGHIDGDPDKPVILGAVHDASKPNLVNRLNDPLGTISRVKSQGGNVMEMQDDGPHKSLVMANGNLNTIQMFGRGSYQHPIDGSSAQNAERSLSAPLGLKKHTVKIIDKNERSGKVATGVNAEPSSSQFAETEASYAISPSLLVDALDTVFLHVYNPQPNYIYLWFVKRMTTADEDAFIYEEPSPTKNATLDPLNLRHGDDLDHTLVPMTEAEKNALRIYAGLTCTVGNNPTFPSDAAFPFTIPANSNNWSWEISCIPYKRSEAVGQAGKWVRDTDKRQFLSSVECNQDANHPLIQQFFKQLELMDTPGAPQPNKIRRFDMMDKVTNTKVSKASITREFKDFARSMPTAGISEVEKEYSQTGVPNDGNLSTMPKIISGKPPELPNIPGLAKGNVEDVETAFANYEASYGGAQTISIGRNIALSYGDSWEKSYGDTYSWSHGHAFEINLTGNSYSYHLASHDEVSWQKGTVNEYSFGDTKKSYSYIETEESYSKVNVKKKEVSETQTSESTETVHDLARSTENIGRKEEFSAVGASVNLAIGGPQFEMSLNGPKLSIEGALLSVGLEIGIGVVEISLAKKLEISAGSTTKLELVNETDLKPKHDDLVVMKTELTTLNTELGALDVTTQQAEITTKEAEIATKKLAISNATTELRKSTLGLYSGIAIFA
jgi:type VI secretion system VgrG family protein